jgi:hypothetical protein
MHELRRPQAVEVIKGLLQAHHFPQAKRPSRHRQHRNTLFDPLLLGECLWHEPIPLHGLYTAQIMVMLEGEQEHIISLMGLLGGLCLLFVTFSELSGGCLTVVLESCVIEVVEKSGPQVHAEDQRTRRRREGRGLRRRPMSYSKW